MKTTKNSVVNQNHLRSSSFFGKQEVSESFFQRKKMPGEEDENKEVQAKQAGTTDNYSHSTDISTAIQNKAGTGSSLPGNSRSKMESAFGTGFGEVNIHTDNKAAAMSEGLHAHAFTYGQDIFFNAGKFKPDTLEGDGLLAHELAHTIQQRGSEKAEQTSSKNYADSEAEAGVATELALLNGSKKGIKLKRKGLSIQRCDGCGQGCSGERAPDQRDAESSPPVTPPVPEPRNKVGVQLTAGERERITQILRTAGMGTTSTTLTATTGFQFVLHDTAASSNAARIRELQTTSHSQMGEAAAAYVPAEGDAAIARTAFFDPNRPTATESEKANDILNEANRFRLCRDIWRDTNDAHRQSALDTATSSLSAAEARTEKAAARTQLAAGSREKVMTTGLWAVREICRMIGAESLAAVARSASVTATLQGNCTSISTFFSTRAQRMSGSVNVEIIQNRGSDCYTTDASVQAHNRSIRRQIVAAGENAEEVEKLRAKLIPGTTLIPLPPYTENQYLNIGKLYLNAALQAGQYPSITTHFLVDKNAGDHCDPRCFDLGHLYSGIATAMRHRADSTYGIQPNYGAGHDNNVWWNDTICQASHP